MNIATEKAWLPDFLYYAGQFHSDLALISDAAGNVLDVRPGSQTNAPIRLKNRALLPGLINAHSHAFQRVIRGRTEHRLSQQTDSFWTWRELMYRAANRLTPEDLYIASKMVFLEMAVSGITSVGEFHYLHHDLDGTPYDDPNLLAREVVRAADEIGLRICLLRVAYARSGFQVEPNPLQSRFLEPVDDYLRATSDLATSVQQTYETAWVGVAPHSVRAVPLEYLRQVSDFAQSHSLMIHMHVAEQPAEVSACIEEYGRSPVALLDTEGILSNRFTAVHAIHVSPKAISAIGRSGAKICACPSTERNLGDGVVPVDSYFKEGIAVALGTDSQVQIDLLEDARELEYHLRLQRNERNVLAQADDDDQDALARRLFECATVHGAASIGLPGGSLKIGTPADFFTVDLHDPSIAGSSVSDLMSAIVFSLSRKAIKDVAVSGKRIVEDGRHQAQDEVVRTFSLLPKELWS